MPPHLVATDRQIAEQADLLAARIIVGDDTNGQANSINVELMSRVQARSLVIQSMREYSVVPEEKLPR